MTPRIELIAKIERLRLESKQREHVYEREESERLLEVLMRENAKQIVAWLRSAPGP